ncbi:MAG: hypothetical protein ABI275_01980 [Terrimesophilobacter sp.]
MVTPTMRDRMRPAELLGLSAVFGAFAGLVVLMTTRDIILALIFFGVAFILSVVVIAMLVLAMKPNLGEQSELAERDQDPH